MDTKVNHLRNDNILITRIMGLVGIIIWLMLKFGTPIHGLENWRIVLLFMGVAGILLSAMLYSGRVNMAYATRNCAP